MFYSRDWWNLSYAQHERTVLLCEGHMLESQCFESFILNLE